MSSLISKALTNEKFELAYKVLKSDPDQALQWSTRLGLFDGKTTSRVLPLHEALSIRNVPLKLIQALVQANPRALQTVESGFQRLPLHCACRKAQHPDIIEYLVEKHPQACLEADKYHRLPLHYALTNGANERIFTILMAGGPEAVRGCDDLGWTPAAVACNVGASKSIVHTLLQHHPQSVLIRTKNGFSMRSVIAPGAPNRDELEHLVEETQQKVNDTLRVPSMAQKSLRASKIILV